MRHVEHKTSIYIEFKTLRYDGQILYTEQEREIFGWIILDLFDFIFLMEISTI